MLRLEVINCSSNDIIAFPANEAQHLPFTEMDEDRGSNKIISAS